MIEYNLNFNEIQRNIVTYIREYTDLKQELISRGYNHTYCEYSGKEEKELCILICFSKKELCCFENSEYYFDEWRDKAFKDGRKIPFWKYQFQISENERLITILDAECIVSYLFDYFRVENMELRSDIEDNYIGKAKWLTSPDGELYLNVIFEKEQN